MAEESQKDPEWNGWIDEPADERRQHHRWRPSTQRRQSGATPCS